ncbi:MAG: DUF2171 domain-containing protein [Pseudomonadota bacterium]
MAYDRYDTRDTPRDDRSRWSEDRYSGRGWRGDNRPESRASREDRGFFERAGDEIASWFGDDDADRRRREGSRQERWESPDRDVERERGSGYRPITGDYGRSERYFSGSDYGRGEPENFGRYDRSQTPYGRDEYRRTSFAGSRDFGRDQDPHYRSWRDRHLSELDRDYDEFRRENQSRFESEFGTWRERRQQKRSLLGQVREHMEVVGNDDEHVGTVDRVAGDRLILAKSDPDSGGAHHSLSCSDIDRVEGDRVILDCSADQARNRWRDESRGRALFEREEQGEMGPRMLDRSFEGTYR